MRTLGYIDSPPPPTHFSKRLDTWGIPLAARFHVSDRGGCPDAVVLDLNMPEMRANSIVRDVRRLMASQQVIVLSGRGTSKEECVRMLGATEVIDKSATPHSLVKILGRIINHSRPERASTLRLNHGEWRVIS